MDLSPSNAETCLPDNTLGNIIRVKLREYLGNTRGIPGEYLKNNWELGEYMGIPGNTWEYLGNTWEYLGYTWEYLRNTRNTWGIPGEY